MTGRPAPDYEGPPAGDQADGPVRPVTTDVTSDAGGGPATEVPAEETEDRAADAILTDVAALSAERDEYLAALQRLKADFDNYRKRVLRQQEEQAARAAADLVGKLLPVLDTFDLARAHLATAGSPGAADESQAIAQARAQLLDTLAKEGLERVDAAGVPFDPTIHDAVAHAPAEPAAPAAPAGPSPSGPGIFGGPAAAGGEAGTPGGEAGAPDGQAGEAGATGEAGAGGAMVDEVMRAGYRWRGQVLRPAMVRVRG